MRSQTSGWGRRTVAALGALVVAPLATIAVVAPVDAAGTNPRFLHSVRTADGSLPMNFGEHQISDNRRKVVFLTHPPRHPNQARAYFRNLRTGRKVEVSRNRAGFRPTYVEQVEFTPDEKSVVFSSWGRDLITNKRTRVQQTYIRNLRTGRLTMVGARDGVAPDGAVGSAVFSADMTRVAFASAAGNLVPGDRNEASDIFVQDLRTDEIRRVTTSARGGDTNGACTSPDLSANGNRLVFECDASNVVRGDTNRAPDVFLANLRRDRITRVSVNTAGRQANGWSMSPRITPNGRKVAFSTYATNLVGGHRNELKVVIKRLRNGHYRRSAVGQVNWLSPDFTRMIHELVIGVDVQLYLVSLDGRHRRLLSVNRWGQPAKGGAFFLSFTRDGEAVMFVSNARNLGRKVPPNGWNFYLRRV